MILALKTAGQTTEMQLLAPSGDQIALATWESGRTLADHLLKRIIEFLADNNAKLPDLGGVIIFSGPGSFTSLRIGHTVANALADSLGLRVVGESGDNWANRGLVTLRTAKPGRPALPHYGAEAHITRPEPHQTSKA